MPSPAKTRRCYPVTWTATTPSAAALAALEELYATHFESASAYRAWLQRVGDPERSFEVWNERLGRVQPPPRELVERLLLTDRMLAVRLMLHSCRGDDRCGVTRDTLTTLVKSQLGHDRALRWLEGSEPPIAPSVPLGETYFNLLSMGESLFSATDAAALEGLWTSKKLMRTPAQAMLGVLLARLRPTKAHDYYRQLLAHGPDALTGESLAIGLHEAARRDPRGMESELASWFFVDRAAEGERRNERAIFWGLTEADDSAAPVLARLLSKRPLPSLSASAADALHRAGTRFGCTELGESNTLAAPHQKGQSDADYATETARAEAARRELVSRMRTCATKLAQRPP